MACALREYSLIVMPPKRARDPAQDDGGSPKRKPPKRYCSLTSSSLVTQPLNAHAHEKGSGNIHCVQRAVQSSRMWRDQLDRSICNQIAIIIYSRIINIIYAFFFYLSSCSTSTEDLLIYSKRVCAAKTTKRSEGLLATMLPDPFIAYV